MAQGRKTGGRQRGTPNKATAEVRAIAQRYSAAALGVLASIMRNKKAPPAARVAAAKEILDRAHGRPAQAITGADGAPIQAVVTFGGRYKPEARG